MPKKEVIPQDEAKGGGQELGEASQGSRDGIRGIIDPGSAEYIRILDLQAQYEKCLGTLWHYNFLTETGKAKQGDVPVPSFENVMSTFSPEELAIASYFQKPILLLIPENSFAAKVKALNRRGGRWDSSVHPNFISSDSGSDIITGWRAVIADGANEMEAYKDDNIKERLDERIKKRKAARRPNEKGMDRNAYMLLMMESLKDTPVDLNYATILDDDPTLSGSFVPHGCFSPGPVKVLFVNLMGDEGYRKGSRFRSSVGGKVEMK